MIISWYRLRLTYLSYHDKVVLRFRKRGVEVELIGLNEASADLIKRLAIHHKVDPSEKMPIH